MPFATTPERRRRFRAFLRDAMFIGAVVLVVVLAMRHMHRTEQRGGGGRLAVGAPAPALQLADLRTGRDVRLGALRGQPVIINFWATWCAPCVRELPALEQLSQESQGRYSILTVTSEQPAAVRGFLQQQALTLPVLYDASGRASAAYKVQRLPTTVVVDQEGLVVHDFTGEAHIDILRDHLDSLL